MISVAIILATGIYGSTIYVPTIYSLFHTYYGTALLAKIVLFLIMAVLGAFHYIKGKKRGHKRIHFTIGLEFAAGILVIVAATILTNLPTAMSSPGPFDQTKVLDNGYEVSLKINPNVEGVNSFTVGLKNKDGEAVTNVEQVSLTFSHEKMVMDENSITVPKHSSNRFQTKGMYLNMSGDWKVTVHVLTKSLDSFNAQFRPAVGSQ
jgi:copper transport protein